MKNIVAQFNIVDFTVQKYDQTIKDLKAAGVGSPQGRLYHVVTHQPVGMLVTDVWESEEALNKFSEKLIPILKKNGVTPAKPTILQVHNIIK
jgi:predicted transcriptional regulator